MFGILSEAQIGILDLFSGHIGILVTDVLIVLVNLAPDIIQMEIDTVGLDALAFGPAAFDLPDGKRGGNLCTYGQTNEMYKENSRKSDTADRKPIS